ncbi:MAG: dTDP-4-dehydrorhamnose 3,5-epimerase [Verrucomicrobiota bacterium]
MNSRFDLCATPLAGLTLIQRLPIGDARGFLERLYCADELAAIAPGKPIAQINHTLTVKQGVVRGLHFQRPPHAEIKLVSCLRGAVFDVAVDLRANSPTFLHWHAEVLSAQNHRSLAIPAGFAHGFQTLTENCEMLYLHTAAYHPAAEEALNARDPRLAIRWPEAISDLSPRDAAHPLLDADFKGVTL